MSTFRALRLYSGRRQTKKASFNEELYLTVLKVHLQIKHFKCFDLFRLDFQEISKQITRFTQNLCLSEYFTSNFKMSTTSTTTAQQASLALSASLSLQEDVKQGKDAVATGGYEFPGIPEINDPYQKRQWQLEHMAGAFRVFARKGFTEGTSGHISVRDTVDPSTFWINP